MKNKLKSLKLNYIIIAVIVIILLLILFNINNIIAQSQSLIVTFRNKLITVTYNPPTSSGFSGGDGDGDTGPGDDDDDDDDDGTDGDV